MTSTGAVQLWQHDRAQWTREEALSEIEYAEFVELPEEKISTTHVGDVDESFAERITRQLSDAKVCPNMVILLDSYHSTLFVRVFRVTCSPS